MTSVAEAVRQRENTPAELTPSQVAAAAVEEQLPRFRAVLPRGWDQDRFTNLVVAAVRRSPDLIRCFETPRGKASLLIAAIQCASIGLEPNTPLHEAALTPRKRKGVNECLLIIEYRGLIKLARRSGEISTITAEVVHQRDKFDYALGTEPRISHVPYDGDDDPGPLRFVYCVVTFRDGGTQFMVVPRRVVYQQHRARSDSWSRESSRPYSPWTTDEAAMWRKTAVRVIAPFLPLNTELQMALDVDERSFDVEGDAIVPTIGSQAYDTDDVIDVDDDEPAGAGDGPLEPPPSTGEAESPPAAASPDQRAKRTKGSAGAPQSSPPSTDERAPADQPTLEEGS